jgi:UDPglucose--hexose-1-phosphate uridylyltransferase
VHLPESLLTAFTSHFGGPPSHVAQAPGRINLLGEHVDYNHGWVLPAAVNRYVSFAARRSATHHWLAVDLSESLQAPPLGQPGPTAWANYLLGVIDAFERRGIPVPPLDLAFSSSIPMGAGLSSSAALCSGFALLLQEFCSSAFSRKDLALIAQESEHRFAGVHCGLMDQYASLFGVSESIVFLDCLSLTHEIIPAHLPDHTWLVVDSGVKHAHAEGAYNARRAAAEAALAALQAAATRGGATTISTWRDVRAQDLTSLAEAPEAQQRAARYIIGELARSQQAVEALRSGDAPALGQLLSATHAGLRDDYAVSCDEMDALVERCLAAPGVLGARQMGGGFGGCALVLVEDAAAEGLSSALEKVYPAVYRFDLVDGAHAAPVAPCFDPAEHPHRRHNPLLDEWVLVSPQRGKRPWQGAVEATETVKAPSHDPSCYLCAGVTRQGGEVNPTYTGTYVFDNDFPAFGGGGMAESGSRTEGVQASSLFKMQPERGVNRVVCFSERHDVTFAELSVAERLAVFHTWQAQSRALGERQDLQYVQIFENKGAAMGCSNPHPHGQIWAQHSVPSLVARTQTNLLAHYQKAGQTLLTNYAAAEVQAGERVVYENAHVLALVPYWATWPFETLVIQKRPCAHLEDVLPEEAKSWAKALGAVTRAYDGLFGVSFPYSAGFHQAPHDGKGHPEWNLHWHAYPPLLRSASVKKFLVGYELLAEAQRDLTPEQAAERLRACLS